MPQSAQASFSADRKLATAKSKEFAIVERPFEYRNREDKTTLPPNVMVAGSHDVLTNTSGRVAARKGYTLYGGSSSVLGGILSSYDYQTNTGPIQNLRAGFLTSAGNDGKLQFAYTNPISGDTSWLDLLTGLTSTRLNFCDFGIYSADDVFQQSLCLFVNGGLNIWEWSGGVAPLDTADNSSGWISSFDETPANPGSGYVVGDILTIDGGTATCKVTSVSEGGIKTVGIIAGGSGYSMSDVLTVIQSGSSGTATVTVASVDGGGAVTGVTITDPGYNYYVSNAVGTTMMSGGTGCQLSIDVLTTSITSVALVTNGDGYTAGNKSTTGGSGTGAIVTITDVADGSITLYKTNPTQAGFYPTGGTIIINGSPYTYVASSGNSLIGVTPDPTSAGIQGDAVYQQPVSTPNSVIPQGSDGSTYLPITNWTNDLISALNGFVYLGSATNNVVYVSKEFDYKDFTFTAGTLAPDDGTIIPLDSVATAIIPQDINTSISSATSIVYFSAGKDHWYSFQINVVIDGSGNSLRTDILSLLKLAPLHGSQSQGLTAKISNYVAYLSNEPVIEQLGFVSDNLQTPQVVDLSFPIVNDVNDYDFTDGQIIFWQKFILISAPNESKVLIYNMTDPKNTYWEAPQTLPIGRFSIINGLLYGHNYSVPETYQLFDGSNDNGNFISSAAYFAFQNYGMPAQPKNFNEYYAEGYISSNTTLNLNIQFDLDGCASNTSWPILGNDTQIVCIGNSNNSLGKFPLGSQPLGANLNQVSGTPLPPKFREVQSMNRVSFYEYQVGFTSEGIDQQWELLRFGPNIQSATEGNNSITK